MWASDREDWEENLYHILGDGVSQKYVELLTSNSSILPHLSSSSHVWGFVLPFAWRPSLKDQCLCEWELGFDFVIGPFLPIRKTLTVFQWWAAAVMSMEARRVMGRPLCASWAPTASSTSARTTTPQTGEKPLQPEHLDEPEMLILVLYV